MEAKDVDGVHKLLGEYLLRYEVAPIFSLEEIRHWFLPIEGVIESFVTEVCCSLSICCLNSDLCSLALFCSTGPGIPPNNRFRLLLFPPFIRNQQ